ncbi:PREDICTED: testis-specific serine/threonine-protein kinase 4-like, partial [Tauraco erythrolophus]|uniref:testis-specific serine/threonine-protein kinase 4-like n=1 Tax=Tauraco erythrolophus TaxID=121530 RepID=UPI000523C921
MAVLKGLCYKYLIMIYQGMEMKTGFYLLMELALLGSILEWVQHQRPCSQGQVGLWFSQLLLALVYLRSRVIVHTSVVLSQSFCGSYTYTCPEILQTQPYNPFLADTCSVSVILYALLLGCMPFHASNLQCLPHQTSGPSSSPEGSPCSRTA